MTLRIVAADLLMALTCAGLLSMSQQAGTPAAPHAPPAAIAKVDSPTMADTKPRDLPGMHNVVAFHQGFYSGGVPEGDEAFATLAKMGVKTIISVDGAEPNVAAAKAHGMRYIHLPIGYNGFDEKRKRELTRATRDAMQNGEVYLHCHHGKHRSAGAAGAVIVSLGWATPDEATARMKVSGTAPNYTGLYGCVAKATVMDVKIIDAVSADFPEVSPPPSYVKAMVEIDVINDHLKAIEKVGWVAPKDHPDLVPAAEAGRMSDLFRHVADSEKARANPAEFATWLREDADRIAVLEKLLADGEKDIKKLSDQFKIIQTSCKDCHTKYRD